MIGLSPEAFWDMNPREFFNAWIGSMNNQAKQLETIRNIVFSSSRYNAANTAFSSEAAKKISNMRFPWEEARKVKPLNYDKMRGLFNRISK